MAFGPEAGLALIDTIAGEAALRNYAPLPAARGDFLLRAGRAAEAKLAFEAAAALAGNERERDFLLARAAVCGEPVRIRWRSIRSGPRRRPGASSTHTPRAPMPCGRDRERDGE